MRSIAAWIEDWIDPLLCDGFRSGKHVRPDSSERYVSSPHEKGRMVVPQEGKRVAGQLQVAVVDQNNKVSIRPVKMGERMARCGK